MKQKIILIVFLSINSLIGLTLRGNNIQKDTVVAESKDVYNFKGEPTSCVDNLEKLFAFWPVEEITNAKDIELISYTSYGAIKDSIQIDYYANLMTQWDSPISGGGRVSGMTVDGERYESQHIHILTQNQKFKLCKSVDGKDREAIRKAYENELLNLREFILNTIKIGDRVFSIKFNYMGKEMESYIICDYKSNKVAVDFIFSGVILGLYDKNGHRIL